MESKEINLDSQRQSISFEAGDKFQQALEGKLEDTQTPGFLKFVKEVQSSFSEINDPNKLLLATKLDELSNFKTVTASLERQVGVPVGFGINGVRDRLAGREQSTIIAFPGSHEVLPENLKEIKKKLNFKGIKIFFQKEA